MCICFLMLCTKLPQFSGLDNTHLFIIHIFFWSEAQTQISWILCLGVKSVSLGCGLIWGLRSYSKLMWLLDFSSLKLRLRYLFFLQALSHGPLLSASKGYLQFLPPDPFHRPLHSMAPWFFRVSKAEFLLLLDGVLYVW